MVFAKIHSYQNPLATGWMLELVESSGTGGELDLGIFYALGRHSFVTTIKAGRHRWVQYDKY